MSEDSDFLEKNKPQMNADERRCGVDLCGSLGKGVLAREKIESLGHSSGLTPISFGDDVQKRSIDRKSAGFGFSTTEYAENTEMLGNSPGLSTLHPFDEIHSIKKKSVSLIEGISNNEDLETLRNSSGLTPLNFDSEPPMDACKQKFTAKNAKDAKPGFNKFCYNGE